MAGFSDPEDAEWLPLTKFDHKTGQHIKEGELLVSIEILPKVEADGRPAGFGRHAPNQNPTLPAPLGRLKFSINPCYMLEEFMGPKLCRRFVSCIFCSGLIVAAVFLAPFFQAISGFLGPLMQIDAVKYTLIAVVSLIVLIIVWYCCIKPFCCTQCVSSNSPLSHACANCLLFTLL